ncbi:hypothetical protein HKX48_001262 [Thoreauomyces humboldtii]|nr:hypothetical protein HKX48_001262 [Thoreauomyces humboldtii]
MTEYKESYKEPSPLKSLHHRSSAHSPSTLNDKKGSTPHVMHDRACKAGAAAVLASRAGKKRGDRKDVLPPIKKRSETLSPHSLPGPPANTTVPAAPPAPPPLHLDAPSSAPVPPRSPHYQTSLILPGMMTIGPAHAVLPAVPSAPAAVTVPVKSYVTAATEVTATAPAKAFRPGPPARVGYGENKPRYDIITGYPLYGSPYSGFKEGQRAVIETFQHMDAVANARSPHYNIITGSDALAPSPSRWPTTRDVVEVQRV